jgi:DNA-binding GntR family transcriptional regulator
MQNAPHSLRYSVVSELRRRIVEGDCALGARLSENVLAIELGVSRTPVREALMTLQDEGLVEVRPQRGTYVFSVDAEDTRQLCDLRGILEIGALRLAAEDDGARLARRLGDIVAEAEAAQRRGKLRDCEQLDRLFHETLIDASDNTFLIESYRRIAGRVNALRFRLPADASRVGKALKHHGELVQLIADSRVAEAADLLRGHVRNVFSLLAGGTSQSGGLLQP